MPAIRIQAFKGTAPRISARLLDPSMAQQADDARLFNKEIRAYRGTRFVAIPFNGINTATIYRYVNANQSYWFDWATPVQVARVPITSDTLNRIYYTGDGVPKKTGNDIGIPVVTSGPANWYNMGVRNPPTAPSAAVTSGPGTGTSRAVAYVITYVTGWGEESGPSPAFTLTYANGDTVTVTRAADAPDAKYNITKWRVYRTITGANGVASFFFVGEQPVFATTTFVDAVTDTTLATQGTFPSTNQINFAEPPTDLLGLTALPNGMLAGFSPALKQVCFSEPYFPYAWPINYRRGLVYDPVGAAALGNMLVVATSGKPAVFIGNSPSAISGDTKDALQSCGSIRSVQETPFGVVWASPDGLYMVGPGGVGQIISRSLYDKATWTAVTPGGIIAATYDGRYYFFAPSISRIGILDPNEPDDALTFCAVQPTAIFSDFNADGLYMVINGQIVQWDSDGASYRSYDWRSKVVTEPSYSNKAYGRVLFDIPNIAGAAFGSFTAYANARTAVIALNSALAIAAYAGPSFGAYSFGEHAFGADDFLDVPPDIGTSITYNLYGDGVLRATRQITTNDPFRLPGGYQAKQWEQEVIGKVNVKEMACAESMNQMQGLD